MKKKFERYDIKKHKTFFKWSFCYGCYSYFRREEGKKIFACSFPIKIIPSGQYYHFCKTCCINKDITKIVDRLTGQ